MTSMIIVDSGCANLNSVFKAAKAAGLNPSISDKPELIEAADALIFPGVGSFGHAMNVLKNSGLIKALCNVRNSGRPFLGICLGMQLLFSHSEESGQKDSAIEGLGFIQGRVVRFPQGLPVPHVGWNRVCPKISHPLFEGLEENSYFYYTHSYHVLPENKKHILAESDYGSSFTAAILDRNLMGVQFHPEKSGPAGLRLLSNFGNIIADHYKK